MAYQNSKLSSTKTQLPPVVAELEAVFATLPDEELLTKLQPAQRRGPKGYDPSILWRCYVALYVLGLPSVSDLIRTLYDNPFIAMACGIEEPDEIPSQPTFSRFYARLAGYRTRTVVRNVLRTLSQRLADVLPGFGNIVAVDSTDIKGWSNGGKKGKRGKVSDQDAGWCVKKNTEGKSKFVWGYKAHVLCDAHYELPIAVSVTAGNVADVMQITPLLQQARVSVAQFWPRYVLADAAYSSDKVRAAVHDNYYAEPVIDPNPTHKRAVRQAWKRTAEKPELRSIYNMRTSVERLFGRLKGHRRLNSVRVRGRFKVRIHAILSIAVLQAQALATGGRASVRKVA